MTEDHTFGLISQTLQDHTFSFGYTGIDNQLLVRLRVIRGENGTS